MGRSVRGSADRRREALTRSLQGIGATAIQCPRAFILEVRAQRGQSLPVEVADERIADADQQHGRRSAGELGDDQRKLLPIHGRCHGAAASAGVPELPDLRLQPTLRIDGPILLDLGQEVTVDGALVLAGETLGIERLAIGFDAQPDVLRATGSLPLDGSPADLVTGADFQLDLAALPLAPIFTLSGLAPARGQITGRVEHAADFLVGSVNRITRHAGRRQCASP